VHGGDTVELVVGSAFRAITLGETATPTRARARSMHHRRRQPPRPRARGRGIDRCFYSSILLVCAKRHTVIRDGAEDVMSLNVCGHRSSDAYVQMGDGWAWRHI